MSRSTASHRTDRITRNRRITAAALASAARPLVEHLETRVMHSVTSNIVDGQLVVTGESRADVITIEHPGTSLTLVNGKAFADNLFNNIVIDAGDGNDIVNIRGTTRGVSVETGAGDDFVNLGNAGLMSGIKAVVNVTDSRGNVAMTLDDSADKFKRNVVITSIDDRTVVSGLAPADVLFSQAVGLSALTVNGGSAGNKFTLQQNGATANVTTINSGTGIDDVTIEKDVAAVVVNGQSGRDVVRVGRTQGVLDILRDVTITNTGSFSDVVVDDSVNGTNRNLRFDVETDKAGIVNGTITGFGNATIRYRQSDVRTVTLNAGGTTSGGNAITVADTVQNSGGITYNLNTGNGNDTVNVQRNHATINIDGIGGQDTVTLGIQGRIRSVGGGGVNVRNSEQFGGSTTLVLDDSTDQSARNVVVGRTDAGGFVTGLAETNITFRDGEIVLLSVDTGIGANTVTVADTVAFANTQVFTHGEATTVNVQRTSGRLDLGVADGHGVFNLGLNNDVRSLVGDINVSASDGASATLNVNAAQDPASRNIFIDALADGTSGALNGLMPAQVLFDLSSLDAMTVNAGNHTNSFNVFTTLARPDAVMTLNTGTLADKVFVRATGPAALVINGQNGLDTVSVGSKGHDLTSIHGDISVNNLSSFTSITIDDANDDAARTVNLDVKANAGGTLFGSVTGLTGNASVRYKAGDLATLNVIGGAHGNTFNVSDTAKTTRALTIVSAGTGDDIVNVRRTTGAINVDGVAGNDAVNIGLNGNAQGISGDVIVTNLSGATALTINDQADITSRTVTMNAIDLTTAASPNPADTSMSGLTPGRVVYALSDVSAVTVNAGIGGSSGGNTFNVNGTAPGRGGQAVTTINAGDAADKVNVFATTGKLVLNTNGGDDIVTVGSTSGNLDPIQGVVQVNAGDGNDSLTVNDQGSGKSHVYTLRANAVDRSGASTVLFDSVESLDVRQSVVVGNGGPSAPRVRKLGLTPSVRAGKSAVLSGRLVDDDKKDKLSLVIDWGDGSKVTKASPNRDPFALKHKYAKKGVYNVRLIWTDSTGRSNFQDMKINVLKAKAAVAGSPLTGATVIAPAATALATPRRDLNGAIFGARRIML